MDWTKQDREQRDRLQKHAGVGERRANIVSILNGVSENDVIIQRSAGDVLTGLRNAAQGRARTVRDMNAKHDFLLKSGRIAAEPDLVGNDPPYRERFVSELRATRVRDAAGAMHGAQSTEDGANDGSDHWVSGEVSDAMDVLSVADMKHIASMRWRGRFF